MNDVPVVTPPDRLSTDPRSPFYDADMLARDIGMAGNPGAGSDDRRCGLREDYRGFGDMLASLSTFIEARPAKFLGVVVIVLSDAKDITAGGIDRGKQGR